MTRLLALPALFVALLAAAAPAPARPADEAEVERVRKQADEIMGTVEKIRGLKLLRPVEKGIKDRDELRKFVLEELEKDMPEAKAKAQEKAYVKIGFLKPGTDLRATLVDLYTEQIAGFYDPETKQLYLVEHGGPEQAMLMAHELTHALQDQHFDLLPLEKSITDNDDRSMALTCLVEGDATVAMIAFLLKEQGLDLDVKSLPDIGMMMNMSNQLGALLGGDSGQEKIKAAPKILSEDLLFGYTGGASFCQRLIKAGGSYKAVSQAFKDLPVSSSQILHPEKYFRHEEPNEITLPPLAERLGDGWKLLEKNVMGEFNTALLFKEKLASGSADRAAAGWAGDAWQALEGPAGEVVFCWYSMWDSEDAAARFADTYKKFAAKRDAEPNILVHLEGTTVVIVDGAGDSARARLHEVMAQETKTRAGYGAAVGAVSRADDAPAGTAPAAPAWTVADWKAPEGWNPAPARGEATVYAGPNGERLRIDESPMAGTTLGDELKRHQAALGTRGTLEDYFSHAAGSTRAFEEYTIVTNRGGKQAVQRYLELRGDKVASITVSAPPERLEAARAAVLAANPGREPMLDRKRFEAWLPGDAPRPRKREKEPQLY
jgi:hypothetical protein